MGDKVVKDKRIEKLNKHFPVGIDGKKVKILYYKIVTDENDRKILTMKTKVRSSVCEVGSRMVTIELLDKKN